jgi:hypothetical protein
MKEIEIDLELISAMEVGSKFSQVYALVIH